MSKLVVFGDSFACYHFHPDVSACYDKLAWFNLLAQQLEKPLLRFSENGTSINFSTDQLYNYINSNDYEKTDIIVFVTTSLTRVPFISKQFPASSAAQWLSFLHNAMDNNHRSYKHFNDHRKFYKTLFNFYDTRQCEQWITDAAFLLKSLPNKTVILSGFADVDGRLKNKELLSDSDNFVLINSKLSTISQNELHESLSTDQFFQRFRTEARHSHLSKTNNAILSEQVFQCIKHNSRLYFDETQYKKNFISLLNPIDIELYDQELLPNWRIVLT
tara:strand:+ start:885 stop:1706 length:822 start_codon:yes stop_codon:yes gene_type:complete